MDNQSQWGRFDRRIGAVVDDNTRTVWAKGLGWVNDRGDVFSGGKWFPMDQHHPEASQQAMAFAAKAKQAFAQGGMPTQAPVPVPDQMRQVQQRAAAPKPATPPAPPANSTHAEIAKSFRHMANVLTKSGGA